MELFRAVQRPEKLGSGWIPRLRRLEMSENMVVCKGCGIGSGQVTCFEIEVRNDLYLHEIAMGDDRLWPERAQEACGSDLSSREPILLSIAAFTQCHRLGQIVADFADIGACKLSPRIRHRLRDHPDRDNVVEIRPGLDRVGEVEPSGASEAEVGQFPILPMFLGDVELDEVHHLPNRCHNVCRDRLPSALEVTAENCASDGCPGWSFAALTLKLGDWEGMGDEGVDVGSSGLEVGKKRVLYSVVKPYFEDDLEVVWAGEHRQVREVERLFVAE